MARLGLEVGPVVFSNMENRKLAVSNTATKPIQPVVNGFESLHLYGGGCKAISHLVVTKKEGGWLRVAEFG